MSKRKTLQEWQNEIDLIHNFEFDILETPISGHQKVNVIHKKCGNILFTSLRNQSKRYCAYCSRKNKKTIEEWQTLSDKTHNFEFSILEYPINVKESVKILHKKCGGVINMTMNNHINHKNGCKKCSKYSLKSNQYWIDRCLDIWGESYEIMEEVSNVWQKVSIKHNICGNILKKDMNNLIHNKRGCDICSKKTFGEEYIEKSFINENIVFEKQKSFQDLINPKTGRKLRIDFWIPCLNIGIEVDGIQHRKSIPHWGGEKEYISQIYRDNIKNRFFEREGYKLVRITNQELEKIKLIINEYNNKRKNNI